MKTAYKCIAAQKLFSRLPINSSSTETLTSRRYRLSKILAHLNSCESDIKNELLKYIPIFVYSVYEYYFIISTYMIIKNITSFYEIYNRQFRISEKDSLIISKYKIDFYQYHSIINFTDMKNSIKILKCLKEWATDNNITNNKAEAIESLDLLINRFHDKQTITNFHWFKDMRNYFAHHSPLLDLNWDDGTFNFISRSNDILSLLIDYDNIANKIFDNLLTKPFNHSMSYW